MQIHELNNFAGTLGAGAYLAVDDGNDTGKLSTQQLLAATEARIDNIIAGPAPSAEEIVDARYGADGVTYPSLGDAIRDQVSDLKDDFSDIDTDFGKVKDVTVIEDATSVVTDLTSSLTFTEGYINTAGETGASSSYKYSEPISVNKGDVISTDNTSYNLRYITAYKNNVVDVAKGADSVASYVVPKGVDSVVVTVYSATNLSPNTVKKTVTTIDYINKNDEAIDALQDAVDVIEDTVIIEKITEETVNLSSLTFTSGYMDNHGATGASANYQYTNHINVAVGEIYMSANASYPLRYVTAFNGNTVVTASGAVDALQGYVVPDGVDNIVITVYVAAGSPSIKKTTVSRTKKDVLEPWVQAISDNTIYNRNITNDITSTLTFRNGYVDKHGVIGSSDSYKRSDRFAVSAGDVITTSGTTYPFRYVTAYIGDYACTEESAESVFTYTVPEGVDSVIVSIYSAQSTTEGTVKITPANQYTNLFYNTLANKQVGVFEKAYICLSCDDGSDELATYTIPMIISKGVPCTFGLYKTSDVFLHGYTSTVVDAVKNHDCSIAQHGMTEWVGLTAKELVDFFNDEEAFWNTIGVSANGAIYPAHKSTPMIRAIAGARFGCCRSGYNYDGTLYYDDGGVYSYYGTGARSNLYAMSSWNMPAGKDLPFAKACIDWAIANNKLIHFYWHDWDLDATSKQVLEAAIDYAKTQSITFVKLSDIPTLT